MGRQSKTAQLQIRVSPADKAAIHRAARRAGMEMSAYVLGRALPDLSRRFHDLATACHDQGSARFALAELNSLLSGLTASELREAVAEPLPGDLSPYLANYIAAMVEHACAQYAIPPPAWTCAIVPLAEPAFGSSLESLRLHLLTQSPPPFRRRNIFIDATLGAQT